MYQDKKYIHLLYLATDILLISLSLYASYSLRYNRVPALNQTRHFIEYRLLFFFWGLSLIFILNNHALYFTDRSLSILKETWRVIKSVILSLVLTGLVIFLLQMNFVSRFVIIISAAFLILSLSSWRALKRTIIRSIITKGFDNTNILIVGAGNSGRALAEEIENNSNLGLKIIGFLDDKKTADVLNYKIFGEINALEHIVHKYFIDEIYVTIPSERKKVYEILLLGNKLGKVVRIIADNFTLPFAQVKLNYIGLIPLIKYTNVGSHPTEAFIKRILDVLVSIIGIILLTPLFVAIAFLIKIESPGPIFYRSLRCGKKGKLFNFYKFRSMFKDADNVKETLRHKSEVRGPVFKIKNDPRITRFGKFLRRYSLDELPQLINVLKGDMSLVGPRPPTPDEVAKYDIWQMRRLDVRPGITCLWQVRGRSDLTFYKWMKWDLWYIDNWSFALDLQILLWTIPAVLKRKGAY